MTQAPLVSIIIPTFNRAHLIGETLDSVLAQTYQNWECIVVDDGSTDSTDAVVGAYVAKDPRFKYYHRPPEHLPGGNGARNFGFKMSRGEYVNWFDDDDLMHPDKLKFQLYDLKNTDAFYSICQSYWYDNIQNEQMGLRCNSIFSKNPLDDYLTFTIFWHTNAVIWKREFIVNNFLKFDESLYQSQDYDFHFRALLISSKYIANNKPLITIMHHPLNISSSFYNSAKKVKSNILVRKKIIMLGQDKIRSTTLFFALNSIHKVFKDLIVLKKYSLAFYTLLVFSVSYLSIKELPVFFKLKRIQLLALGLMCYFLFNRGYNLVHINLNKT